MAFGNYGYQPGYMPGYYPTQAMPDQLAQLRMAQPQPMQGPSFQPQAAPQPQSTGLIWVQGEAGAKSYLVANGNSVLLMDSESPVFYIKSADASGMPSMRVFDYAERIAAKSAPPAVQPTEVNAIEYATKREVEILQKRMDELTSLCLPKEAVKDEPTV